MLRCPIVHLLQRGAGGREATYWLQCLYLYVTVCRVNDEDVRLMLWDTAGQEEFDAITKAYYRGQRTHGLVPVLTHGLVPQSEERAGCTQGCIHFA